LGVAPEKVFNQVAIGYNLVLLDCIRPWLKFFAVSPAPVTNHSQKAGNVSQIIPLQVEVTGVARYLMKVI